MAFNSWLSTCSFDSERSMDCFPVSMVVQLTEMPRRPAFSTSRGTASTTLTSTPAKDTVIAVSARSNAAERSTHLDANRQLVVGDVASPTEPSHSAKRWIFTSCAYTSEFPRRTSTRIVLWPIVVSAGRIARPAHCTSS